MKFKRRRTGRYGDAGHSLVRMLLFRMYEQRHESACGTPDRVPENRGMVLAMVSDRSTKSRRRLNSCLRAWTRETLEILIEPTNDRAPAINPDLRAAPY